MSATTTPIGHATSAPQPAPSHEAQIWDRVDSQIQWYGRNARRSKRNYMRIKLVQIVAAAFIPVLAAASLPSSKRRFACVRITRFGGPVEPEVY